jgi:hypothetical protein
MTRRVFPSGETSTATGEGLHCNDDVAGKAFVACRLVSAAITFRKLAALPRGDDDLGEKERTPSPP